VRLSNSAEIQPAETSDGCYGVEPSQLANFGAGKGIYIRNIFILDEVVVLCCYIMMFRLNSSGSSSVAFQVRQM